MGEYGRAGTASYRRAHENLWPDRRQMHDCAAEDRIHHPGKGGNPLTKKSKREKKIMIYVVATTQVKPDLRDAFIKGAKECIEATRKGKGCLSYESHTSI